MNMSMLHNNTTPHNACSSDFIRNQQLVPNNTRRTGQKELTKFLSRSILGAIFLLTYMFPTSAQITTTYTSSSTFTVPAGVTELAVECWGGGGRGGTRSSGSNTQAGGGGGGAYAYQMVTVVPGNTYTITVGLGSTSAANSGGDSWFNNSGTVMAKGGSSVPNNNTNGAAGGTAASSVGSIRFNGGNGANSGNSFGGGGGSSAGYTAAGGNAPGLGLGGTAPAGGGAGGSGPLGLFSTNSGGAGTVPGGAGGGGTRGFSGTGNGGSGANGRVIVSYYTMGTCMPTVNSFNSIPDNGCGTNVYGSIPFNVNSTGGTLGTDVFVRSVDVIVSHTYGSDLRVYLRSPNNNEVALVNTGHGGTGTQYGNAAACPSGLFTFQAGGAPLSGVAASSTNVGIWAPDQSLTTLHDGSDPNGNWSLRTCDAAASDVGAVRYVNVNLCYPPQATITRVNDCSNAQFSANVNVTSFGSGTSATIQYAVNGGLPIILNGVGTGTTNLGPFSSSAEVDITITNGISDCGSIERTIYSTCPVTLDCGTATVVGHCYRNNDTRTFTFVSPTPGETVTLNFTQGTIDLNDGIGIYDGTTNAATPLGGGNFFGNLAGASFTTSGSAIYLEISSGATNSCADGGQTVPWSFEVKCTPGCLPPNGAVTVVDDCPNYNFSLDVLVYDTGDGSYVDVAHSVNGGPEILTPGVYIFDPLLLGPFAVGDNVNVILKHENDGLCDANLGTFTNGMQCPSADDCVNALNLASQTSPLAGTTTGRTNNFSFVCGTATANTAADAIYFINVPNGAELHIRQQSNNYDSQHYVRYGGTCPGTTAIACVDNDASEIGWVTWVNTTGSTQRVWWIQDGFGTGSGNFVLEWQLITCPVAPGPPSAGTTTYSICQNGTVPNGQGLSASCANVLQSASSAFPTGDLISEGTAFTTRATMVVPALPAGAVVTAARLKLTNVVANTGLFGNAQRQNIRVALSGAYTLGETQLTTTTGPGQVTPNPVVITLVGFPEAGGTINFRTRQTSNQTWTNPDVNFGTASIEVDYTVPTTVRWYTAPTAGTLVFTGPLFDPVGQGAVNNTVPGTSTFHATCAYGTCENLRIPATFTVVAPPNAGTNGTLTICSNASPVSLFAQLGGSPQGGGNWSGPSPVASGQYDPSTMNPGTYSYTVTGSSPCPSAFANVVVTENTATLWYADVDGDGFGDAASNVLACTQPLNHVANNTDLCPADGLKQTPGACGCGVADTDSDNDGTANCIDGCPNDPNKIAPGQCGCGNPDTDGDSDGTADCNDGCPNDPNKIAPGQCGCGVVDTDSDGDATADCNDGCPNDPNKIVPGVCGCGVQDVDSDGDGLFDCEDSCPNLTGEIGSPCNDGNAATILDQINGSCTCAGTACTETVNFELNMDMNGSQISWQIAQEGTGTVVCSGGVSPAYPDNVPFPIVESCCLPVGCYTLEVYDSAGDGIVGGGYQLREGGSNGRRIIDNRGNFATGTISSLPGGQDFCVPLGQDALLFSSCDKLDWVNYKYLVVHANPSVSAEWVTGAPNSLQPANSGYEFWIFDPNGTYSYRRFRSHQVSDGFSPATANRACHMKLNAWINAGPSPHVPAGLLLNVRVRGRVNGTNLPFGPTCTMKIDAARASCPLTNLQDDPANPSDFSCGVTRTWGGTNTNQNKLVARPPQFTPSASGPVRFQFRFRIPGENICIVRPPQSSPTLYLNWSTGTPLECSKTYEVEVRVSKDGGATWCVDSPNPACDPAPVTSWGKMCQVSIANCFQGGGGSNMATEGSGRFSMYPNPNNGDQLYFNLTSVQQDVRTVSVDLYDLTGKRVGSRTLPVNDGFVRSTLDLSDLNSGMYMVNVTAGENTFTERLVIQK